MYWVSKLRYVSRAQTCCGCNRLLFNPRRLLKTAEKLTAFQQLDVGKRDKATPSILDMVTSFQKQLVSF